MEVWRQQYLGLETIPPSLTNAEIDFFFTPVDQAWEIIARRRSALSRMGFLLSTQDAFQPRLMMPLSLSYDHRVINGADAARFVVRIGELLATAFN